MSKIYNNVATSSPNKVGAITWQYIVLPNHLALNGQQKENASSLYPELLDFFISNNLTANTIEDYNTNNALAYYDESQDILTLPNFYGRTIWSGAEIIQKEAGLPNIIGWSGYVRCGLMSSSTNKENIAGGAFYWGSDSSSCMDIINGKGADTFRFDASRSNPIYGKSSTVQPDAIQLNPQIRYAKDDLFDIGHIESFIGGATIPQGYLVCDGNVYQISQYQNLADYINEEFGSYNHFGGDGITTFGVPSLNSQSSPVLYCIKY